MPQWELSLFRIFPYKAGIVDSVFKRGNTGQRKPTLLQSFQENKFLHQKNSTELGVIMIHFPAAAKTD